MSRLFETHAADKGLEVCGAQLTSKVGHSVTLAKALRALGSSRLGLQAWAPLEPELAIFPGRQKWSERIHPYPSGFSRERTFEVTL